MQKRVFHGLQRAGIHECHLPFSDARQLLDLRHDLGYFKLQSLKEARDRRRQKTQFSTLDAARISYNAALLESGCRYTYKIPSHMHTLTSISSRSSLFRRRMFVSSSLSSRDRSSGTETHDADSSSQIPLSARNFRRWKTARLSSPASANWKHGGCGFTWCGCSDAYQTANTLLLINQRRNAKGLNYLAHSFLLQFALGDFY